ncbi:Myb-like_DNA-binding domain-containing protein [Hexamita inflata]|uniref:Myb-like DNA-binding domain-containing protein n=1 Tax=Hexamita inflata TaxID=28002 RepID=A0AA86P4G8_9EUKA|nr:Myb-like DNA-binding domain-containing protein [Hexamita inflata]
MRQIQKWTETDKYQLVSFVNLNTTNNRTNWVQVAQQINRTPKQCKSYYTVVIKQCVPKKCNLIWTLSMLIQLIGCVQIYGKKWSLIKKLQFPDYTTEQLRLKYHAFIQFKNGNEELVKLIQKGSVQVKDHPRVKKLYEHFLSLYDSYQNCTSSDFIRKKALQNANEKLQLQDLIKFLEAVIQQLTIE